MASWKKVIVSGSDAILNQLNVGTNQVITTTTPLTSTKITGSFTGSFFGDGTGITGITAKTLYYLFWIMYDNIIWILELIILIK